MTWSASLPEGKVLDYFYEITDSAGGFVKSGSNESADPYLKLPVLNHDSSYTIKIKAQGKDSAFSNSDFSEYEFTYRKSKRSREER